jgi:hypothetical protein
MSIENYGGMISIGETSDSFTTPLWQSYQLSSRSKSGGTSEGNDKFILLNVSYLKGFFDMP